jgi:hypothetical protein
MSSQTNNISTTIQVAKIERRSIESNFVRE